jgi:hypothetical protein
MTGAGRGKAARSGRERMALRQPGVKCSSVRSQRSEPGSRRARILLVDDRAENLIALDAVLSSSS